MTQLVSRDGTYGVVPSTVRKIRKTGAKVLIVGYMRTPGFASPVEQCKDEGDIYDARLKTLARKTKGAYFISNANLVPFGDKTYHGADRIHPSKKGSKEIGKRIAALIRRKDRTRR
jgi:lysophospholipase L1-like esterase